MSSTSYFWSIHGRFAVIALFPLTMTIITGMTYRIARKVFEADKASVGWLMDLHTMSFLGMQYIYPVILGIIASALALAGFPIAFQALRSQGFRFFFPKRPNQRLLHRSLSMVILVPLLLTALTGAAFTISYLWLGTDRKKLKWMLQIHQMSVIMNPAVYVTLLGSGSLFLIFSGFSMMTPYLPSSLAPSSAPSSSASPKPPASPSSFVAIPTREETESSEIE